MSTVELAEVNQADVSSLTNEKTLKQELDIIDQEIVKDVADGYYQSRFRIECAMWIKGKTIAEHLGTFTPLNVPLPSWRELERQTERAHHHLKRWHDLYMANPDEEKYKEIAQQKAEAWTLKALTKIEALSDDGKESLPEPEDERMIFLKDWLSCFFNHFDLREQFSHNIIGCEGCLKIACCKRFEEDIVSEILALREKYLTKKG